MVRPPVLFLGVGCRLEADPSVVSQGVRGALAEEGFSEGSVAALASVDVKQGEPALRQLAETLEVPFETYPAKRLKAVETPTPSARVEQAVGTPSVSEAAALVAAGEGATLVLPKQSGTNWTLAVALSAPTGARDAE